MSVITTFLLVMVGALTVGHGLLFFTKPADEQGDVMLPSQNQMGNATEIKMMESNFRALNEKVRMAHDRINDVEKSLSTLKVPKGLGKQMEGFSNFRANTEIELKAMKEILLELQNNGINIKARRYPTATQKEAEEFHKMIYAGKAKKAAKNKITKKKN
ncbi:MAG: hypothetical protein ABID38_02785 [Candidatus Diapherotrites archaeon]